MALVRIANARPLEGFNVELTLTTGEVVRRDLKPLLQGPMIQSAATKSSFAGCGLKVERSFGRTALTCALTF